MHRYIVQTFIAVAILHRAALAAHELCSEISIESPCELDAVTTADEQREILASVCGVLKATHMDMLVPTVQHRRIDAGAPITEHCAGRTQGFLKWVTWAFYLRHMHEPLNYMEKFLDRQTHGANDTSDVLIEVLPVRYALLDVQPNGARSVRTARSLTLGSLDLGPDNSTGQIPYAYERTLAVRVLDDSIHHRLIEGLSMRTNSSDIEDIIYGHRLVKVESASYEISRVLAAAENVHATLIGSWVIQEYNVTATLISIYSNNLNSSEQITGNIIDTGVGNVHPIYSKEPEERLSRPRMRRINDEVYPGFRPYFCLACIILFGTMFLVFYDVGSKLLHDRHLKRIQNASKSRNIGIKNNGDVEALIYG